MKRTASLLLLILASACSTTTPSPAPSEAAPLARATQAPRAQEPASPVARAVAYTPPQDPRMLFDRQRGTVDAESVYFPYDRYVISPDERSIIEDHAKLATAFPNDHIIVQGNCDERGGREYNLALGQHRAEAVKERLAMLGVPKSHIETVSFGKEKPRALCHEEKCWSQNRRADTIDSWK